VIIRRCQERRIAAGNWYNKRCTVNNWHNVPLHLRASISYWYHPRSVNQQFQPPPNRYDHNFGYSRLFVTLSGWSQPDVDATMPACK
jgi:hypothetical protein